MPKAKKLPSGAWRARAFLGRDENGKQIVKSFTAKTRWEAEKAASNYLVDNKDEKPIKDPEPTVGEVVQEYIESRENILSPSSIRGYYVMLRNTMDSIKDIRIDELTERDLQKWVNTNAGKYAPKSVKSQFSLTVAALRQFKVNLDYKMVLLPRKKKYNPLIPTEQQMATILKMVEGTTVELPVTIALTMGLRQSEIAALTWDDYDGKTLYIHSVLIPNKEGKFIIKDTTKSEASTRRLTVNELCKTRLDRATHKSEYISPMLPSSVLKKFQRLCKDNGLPKFTMHGQRHANASVMLAEGVPDKYAMERLGQSSPNMIKDVYQHLFDSKRTEVSDTISNKFQSIVDTSVDT